MKIKISKEFSKTPGPRSRSEGDFSGEAFLEEILYPAWETCQKTGDSIVVDLDGTAGFGTSFLEQSFGGLVRQHRLSEQDVAKISFISHEEPELIEDIKSYMKEALKRG